MKLIGLLLLTTALTAAAQDDSEKLSKALRAEIERLVREHKIEARKPAPNEVRAGRVTCRGILVQLVRSPRPLQMVNPAAPAEYGNAEQNVSRNPVSGRASGLNFFSIRF
jgi:hypothetical protein